MKNATINKNFLAATDAKTRDAVLSAIALHYGIATAAAFEEVTTEGAEHLLDYLTGSVRSAVSVLMQRRAAA